MASGKPPFAMERTMDPKFPAYMILELEQLLSDLRAGLQPANVALSECVTAHIRKDYDRYVDPARIHLR